MAEKIKKSGKITENQMKCKKKIFSQISIPDGVKIEKKEYYLVFSGVLGFTKLDLTKIDPTGLGTIKIEEDYIFIFSQSKPFFYSLKSLLINKIRGVTVGFLISLRIVGVGYRAFLDGNQKVLHFKLGYSHNLKYQVPEGLRAFLLEPTQICLFGIDKNQVSQVASIIRSFKPPERYKGKGIRFTTEKVSLSQGKRK